MMVNNDPASIAAAAIVPSGAREYLPLWGDYLAANASQA